MLENGADIRFIQQLLGHEKLDTTAIYTEVSIKQLQEVHARCHPSAKLRKIRFHHRRKRCNLVAWFQAVKVASLF